MAHILLLRMRTMRAQIFPDSLFSADAFFQAGSTTGGSTRVVQRGVSTASYQAYFLFSRDHTDMTLADYTTQ
jgi:hypothetical protein